MSVRTRFAPSPTGYLHIGGVRTALFNWLFARQHGGQFILRIDDTDQQRNVEEALQPILDGLHWLGIDWDEGPEVGGPFAPYYQSQRLDRYRAAVQKLLAGGFAYYDCATTAELQAEREAAEREKRTFRYSRKFMAETPVDRARFEAEGRQAVVRLKMPTEGKLVLDDLVRGRVEFDWLSEQDHVIQRTDGTCLYHLANVVDDFDLQISHVIRAEEHLSNTPRQVFILEALGYPRPAYAHLPFVAEPGSRNKLSKRKLDKYLKNRDFAELVERGRKIALAIGHPIEADAFNPVIVDFYKTVGYLPEAIINYMALLGWSLDDKTEHFSRNELIQSFSLDRVNKSPASFDCKKLMAFEDWHFQQLPLERKVALVAPFLEKAGYVGRIASGSPDSSCVALSSSDSSAIGAAKPQEAFEKTPNPRKTSTFSQNASCACGTPIAELSGLPTASPISADERALVEKVVVAAGDRIKTAGDVLAFDEFFTADEKMPYDEKTFAKQMTAEGLSLLAKFRDRLAAVEPFDAATLDAAMHEFVAAENLKIGQIIHPVRFAATGKSIGLGLFDTLAILGRERVLRRIELTMARKPA